MAGRQPLALQLEQLLNPRPREADPEANPEEGEVTGARPRAGPRRVSGPPPPPCVEENGPPEGCPGLRRAPGLRTRCLR